MLYFAFLFTLGLVQSQNRFPGRWTPACCDTPLPDDNCQCDYAQCYWWGDPHTKTFDGLNHHFQGRAGRRYRYVTPCQSDFASMPFQVVTRHRRCGRVGRGLTCTDYVDIRLYDATTGTYSVTLRIDNGFSVQRFTEGTGGGFTSVFGGNVYAGGVLYVVSIKGRFVEVAVFTGQLCDYRPDVVVRANRQMTRVEVDLNEYYKYQSCGICGYYSGTKCDELAVAFKTNSREYCYQFDNDLPRRMRDYTRYHKRQLNFFGYYWRDFGRFSRRRRLLQDPEFPLEEDPTVTIDELFANVGELGESPDNEEGDQEVLFDLNDNNNAALAEGFCQQAFTQLFDSCNPNGNGNEFCQDCADEAAQRREDCERRGIPWGIECIRAVCNAACEGPDCDEFDIEDILPQDNPDGTGTAPVDRVTAGKRI